jgi:hypothetical protein
MVDKALKGRGRGSSGASTSQSDEQHEAANIIDNDDDSDDDGDGVEVSERVAGRNLSSSDMPIPAEGSSSSSLNSSSSAAVRRSSSSARIVRSAASPEIQQEEEPSSLEETTMSPIADVHYTVEVAMATSGNNFNYSNSNVAPKEQSMNGGERRRKHRISSKFLVSISLQLLALAAVSLGYRSMQLLQK